MQTLDAQALADAWIIVTNDVASRVGGFYKPGDNGMEKDKMRDDVALLNALSQAMIAMSQERAHAMRSQQRQSRSGLLLPGG
jgi:hypothetical protein